MAASREQAKGLDMVQADCLRALASLACGRSWLVFVLTVAVLVNVGSFAAAYWGSVLPASQAVAAAQPADAAPDATATQAEPAQGILLRIFEPARWQQMMQVALPVAGFAGLISVLLLVVVAWAGVQMMVLGRLGAVSVSISSFFWALVAVVLLFPWGGIIPDLCGGVLGWAFYGYDEIVKVAPGGAAADLAQPLLMVRFVFWPLVGLLVVWVSSSRFGKAYWQAAGIAELEVKARAEKARDE